MKYKDFIHHKSQSQNCSFCEKRDYIIDQNQYAFVIPARAPYADDHLLIIPKKHGELLGDFSNEENIGIYTLLLKREHLLYTKHKDLVVFIRQGIVGGTSGKSISHLHRHITPNFVIQYGGQQETSDNRTILTEQEYYETYKALSNLQ